VGRKLRYVTISRYQISTILLIAATLVVATGATLAATYFWASKTVPFSVEEPLTVTNYPATFNTHPGENITLDITIMNAADVDYSVLLVFTLNDTTYQQSNVEFSNYTYNIVPGSNPIYGWLKVDKKAPPVSLELTIDFLRE
jgi:hypothetical protein